VINVVSQVIGIQ